MSILIKGIEMPTDCPMCPLSHWDFTGRFRGCKAVNGKRYAMETEPEYFDSNYRPPWCPLVPIPKHGRLIDAVELCKTIIYAKADDFLKAGFISYVKAANTVIEAEGEE